MTHAGTQVFLFVRGPRVSIGHTHSHVMCAMSRELTWDATLCLLVGLACSKATLALSVTG